MNYFDDNADKIFKYVETICNSIIRLISMTDQQYTIFLNVVTSMNKALYSFLQSYPIYLVVRDPRSNYISNIKYQSNIKSLDWFIPYYKQQRENFKQLLSMYKNIKLINYEEFVICDTVREHILHDLELDKKYYLGRNNFDPAKSIKKCFNYEDYPDQQTMKILYENLREYCLDI